MNPVSIQLKKPCVYVWGKRGQFRHRCVVRNLLRATGACDDGGDGRVIENPTLGELSHAHASWNERANRLGKLKALGKGQPGKGLADVEAGAITIVVTMIGFGKGAVDTELSGQESAC